jgi:hypothetical protein
VKQRTLPNVLLMLALLGLIALAIFLAFAVLAALAWLAGWLLRLALPLTLFEGMLLGMLLLVVSGGLVFRFVGAMLPDPWMPAPSDLDAFDRHEEAMHPIPTTRFFASAEERTWEAWLRYEMANGVYLEFDESAGKPANLNDTQLQELAIRLAEIGINILKRKSPRTPSLSVSASALKREMQHMGQQAYDAEILAIAADGINTTIDFYALDISDLLEKKQWQSPAKLSNYG